MSEDLLATAITYLNQHHGEGVALPWHEGDAEVHALVELLRQGRPATPYHALVQHFEDLGAEPCSECDYSLNEIRDFVNIVLAARDLVRSGYDGPFMGEAVEPLFKAVRLYEAAKAAADVTTSPDQGGAT